MSAIHDNDIARRHYCEHLAPSKKSWQVCIYGAKAPREALARGLKAPCLWANQAHGRDERGTAPVQAYEWLEYDG